MSSHRIALALSLLFASFVWLSLPATAADAGNEKPRHAEVDVDDVTEDDAEVDVDDVTEDEAEVDVDDVTEDEEEEDVDDLTE